MLVPQSLVNPGDVAQAIVEATRGTDKTVLACMVGERSLAEARQVLHENHVPMSIFPEVPGQVLGAMQGYREWLAKGRGVPFDFNDLAVEQAGDLLAAAKPGQALGEAETRPILSAYGLDLVAG